MPPATRFGLNGCESFVGYYDIRPDAPDGGAILGHVTRAKRRPANAGDIALLGYFERDSGHFSKLAETTLWCWQLGARLNWWPGDRRALGFNTILNGVPSYCVVAEGRKPDRLTPCPLFDVSSDRRVGIALNFGRLARLRPGYGYPILQDPFFDQRLPDGDGVRIVDMTSGRTDLLFTMGAFAERVRAQEEPDAFHYLNSASLSPTGRLFSILYKRVDSISRSDNWRVDAFVGATDGSTLHRVPLPGRPSHTWWLDDERVAYTSNMSAKSGYHVFNLRDGSLGPLHPAAPDVDGHPSWHADTRRWITDQYPDLYGEQALYILDADGRRHLVGKFAADPRYFGEWRCDLHPRWVLDGSSVVVDSTHHGLRAIYAIEVA